MKSVKITDSGLQLTQAESVEIQQPGDCIISVNHAGLNRRDRWIEKGMYPGIVSGTTLGSDGSGEVTDGPQKWVGKEVIINPNIGWGLSEAAQESDYTILGLPTHGTLAEKVKVNQDRLHLKPEHLTFAEGSALPLAGMTAYRALFSRGNAKEGQNVLVTGIGGGVAQFALQFAIAAGCHVAVTTGNEAKGVKAKGMGAIASVNYRDESWGKTLLKEMSQFDVIIDGAGGESLNEYLRLIKPGGNIVMYGSTTGKTPKFDTHKLFWSQANVMGSTMASDYEFEDMLDFVNEHKIKPVIDDVYKIEDFQAAFDRFDHPDHFGKIVVSI